MTKNIIKALLTNLNVVFGINTLVIALFAILSTYLCVLFELRINFPLTIIGIAVVFPIVFSIGSAYKRRELALTYYGSLKSYGRALYLASRDWITDSKDKSENYQRELKKLLGEILTASKHVLQASSKDRNLTEKEVYSKFSNLSKLIEAFRSRGLPSGEVSRCNSFFSKMLLAFENLKHISQYRTPITLRTYSRVFTYVLPIIYGPYFAYIAKDITSWVLVFMMPFLFSIILVSLANIQSHLEDPFDDVGEDDIKINADKFMDSLDL